MRKREITIDWYPQPRQLKCLEACGLDTPFTNAELRPAIADIIGYGGSAGGGKTDTLLQIAVIAAIHFPKINIAYFRREFPQLEGVGGAIMRSQEMISHFAKYNEQKHRWTFPNGSVLQFCHCKNETDVYSYQSQQIDILLIDEGTQFTEFQVDYLITRNRKTIDDPRFVPFTAIGTNPGNVGHLWFKNRFVSGKPEEVHLFKYETGVVRRHVFIPSKLDDNQILMQRDPTYEDRISTNALNRKMLREGSWDVFAGQAFSELTPDVHIIPYFKPEQYWSFFGAYDHGFNHPFCFGVFAVDGDGVVYLVNTVKDRLKRIDEIARLMTDLYAPYGDISRLPIYAGHDAWARGKKGEPSIAEDMLKLPTLYPELNLPRIVFTRANIDRVQGATQLRNFISWKNTVKTEEGLVDGKPKFYIMDTPSNREVYDTLSSMIFDPNNPEDVLKVDANDMGVGGDDAYDMVRYGLMSRPRAGQPLKPTVPKGSGMDILETHLRQKELERNLSGWR